MILSKNFPTYLRNIPQPTSTNTLPLGNSFAFGKKFAAPGGHAPREVSPFTSARPGNLPGLTDAFQTRRNSPALVLTFLRCTAVVGDEFSGCQAVVVDSTNGGERFGGGVLVKLVGSNVQYQPPKRDPWKKLRQTVFGKSWVIPKVNNEVDESSLSLIFGCLVVS